MKQWRDGRNGADQLPHSKEAEELMEEGESSEEIVWVSRTSKQLRE